MYPDLPYHLIYMRKYLLVLSAFFSLSALIAQTTLPSRYLEAKSELDAGNYWEAMPKFREFLDAGRYGNLANYAAFYLAQSALGANQPVPAIEALAPVIATGWDKSDEAKYLLAVAYFRNQQNAEALRTVKQIKNEEIKLMAENLTFEHLKNVSSSFVIANLKEYQDNGGYRAALKAILDSQSILSTSERMIYNELQGRGNDSKRTSKDEVLDVVVILPFTTSPSRSISGVSTSDFIFELYQGIEFGIESVRKEGTKVNLHTFDSKRDPDHVRSILKDPVIANADVLIGPIYPEESDVVSAFAESAKIPFVHPLSNLGEQYEKSQFSYLFRPSVLSLADGIVDKLKKQNWGRRVAIGYSTSSRDEKLGTILSQRLGREGFQVVRSEAINPRTASDFLQKLGIRGGSTSFDVDQVILLTDDPAIAQPAFSLLESVTASVPTLVMDSWLGFNFANFEMLAFPNFYFISNNTPNFYTKSMADFRKDFYAKYLAFPSLNTTLGLELVYWLSSNMSQTKGFDLRRNLDRSPYQQGQLSWGFNFQNSNNNKFVPVFRLDAGELKPIE